MDLSCTVAAEQQLTSLQHLSKSQFYLAVTKQLLTFRFKVLNIFRLFI